MGSVLLNKGDSFITRMYKTLKDSPMILLVWLFFLAMFISGCFQFYEDTLSSKYGNDWIALTYGVIPFSSALMGWIVAVVPQIAQITGSYILLAYSGDNGKTEKGNMYVRMAMLMTPVFFLLDIGSDIFYRSNHMASLTSIVIGIIYSITYYTIGSEIFVTLGFTFTVMLMFPALGQLGRIIARIAAAFVNLKESGVVEWKSMRRSFGSNSLDMMNSGRSVITPLTLMGDDEDDEDDDEGDIMPAHTIRSPLDKLRERNVPINRPPATLRPISANNRHYHPK